LATVYTTVPELLSEFPILIIKNYSKKKPAKGLKNCITELYCLLKNSWITSYENIYRLQTNNPTFEMKTPGTIHTLKHDSKEIKLFLDKLEKLNLESSNYLLLLAGHYNSGKKRFLKKLKEKVGEFEAVNLREIINANEEESYKKIDELFRYIGETEKNLLFRNGDCLAGEYTGYTYSAVRYATPQEKYLLKKIIGSERFFVIDITDSENIDKTLERVAHTAIFFDEADSLFGKLFWKLRQIKVHGHTFSNKRPVVSGN
jgi:hypothetical protein